MAAVTGTNSAIVIQSMPSMKLTRFTNHTPPMNRPARSTKNGIDGMIRSVSGSDAITASTATHCTTRRTPSGTDRMSSIAPMTASNAVAKLTVRN
jgi:hypothetical protein